MSKYGIEDVHFMLMDIYAMRHTLEWRPDGDTTPLGLLITDDDRRLGIREFFEPETLEDDLVDLVLVEMKQFAELQAQAMMIADVIVASIGLRL